MKNLLLIFLLLFSGCCLPLPVGLPPGQHMAEVKVLGSVPSYVNVDGTDEHMWIEEVLVQELSTQNLYLVTYRDLPNDVENNDVCFCVVSESRLVDMETGEIGKPTVQ